MDLDKMNLLEMIDRPAFLVKDETIVYANQLAKNRQLREGTSVCELLPEHLQAYREFTGGCLYLTLDFGDIRCGASVTRQDTGDVFLMDRDLDLGQLQTLALAGQQLRQPLSTVMILADTLLPKLQADPDSAEMAGQLSRGLFQMLRLISNMADGERYYGAQMPSMENTELASFLREIICKAQAMLEESGVTIHYEGLPKAIFSLVDRERLERAIYNMISNAVKFSPAGSAVTVKAAICGKQVRISVEDQGDGIDTSVQGSLFHRYQREPAIEDSRFGLGLGMTLIRSAAAVHGGTVLIDQSGGTRVTLTIAVRKQLPGSLRSPALRIGDYMGGRDAALVEFSEALPGKIYEKNL